ncbi:MAG: WYL domain-containing protein [Eubacterium sp.]|nr:WYL domain-containing protein [Eubacterium sp.]
MGFIDENGYPLINKEQKIRITLSDRAKLTMAEDMDIFGTSRAATFINLVFDNFKSEAKSSISLYLQQRELELDRLFTVAKLDAISKKIAIDQILAVEKQEIRNKIADYNNSKGESKLYHINDNNVEYLLEDCDEEQYYSRPSLYLRSVIEEYCSLPFIMRERIYRKDIYETIEQACQEKRILKIKANYYGKDQLFYVYPYKIVPDPFHTQSYLVCYSRKAEEEDKDKIVASFSMARINTPTILTKTFHLNKQEIANIEAQLSNYSPAYLIGKPEQIKVRLTSKGKQSYQSRLYSRPEKIDSLSTEDIYVFDCTQQQIYNYFFPFGSDAEIISPENLRSRFKNTLSKACKLYEKI